MSQLVSVAAIAVSIIIASSTARAFSDPTVYGQYPSQQLGGGGNRFFTGSLADGYTCSVCHTAPVAYSFPLYQSGLPLNGYIPGTTYVVTLAWPEAAAWAARVGTPMTGLAAEFVAEDAGPSGNLQLQIDALIANDVERCTQRAVGTIPELASSIQIVKPGLDTQQIISAEDACTTGTAAEDRCVLTVKPCGASRAQIRWTAPAQLRGPIWFSASLVATDVKSSQPNDVDYVSELSIPIKPATEIPGYDMQLGSGCTVGDGVAARGQASGRSWSWSLSWFVLITWLARESRKRRRRAADGGGVQQLGRSLVLVLTVMLSMVTVACQDEALDNPVSGKVGAFEPVDRLDSGTDANVSYGMCKDVKVPAPAGDAGGDPGGMLTVSFTTTPPLGNPMGHFDVDGTHPTLGVVWIQDAMTRSVKTLEQWGLRWQLQNLQTYLIPRLNCHPSADVVSKATPPQHELHTLMWDTKSTDGFVVEDGAYVLWIEVQIDEFNVMPAVSVPFTIGREPWTIAVPDSPPHAGLTLAYTPNK